MDKEKAIVEMEKSLDETKKLRKISVRILYRGMWCSGFCFAWGLYRIIDGSIPGGIVMFACAALNVYTTHRNLSTIIHESEWIGELKKMIHVTKMLGCLEKETEVE